MPNDRPDDPRVGVPVLYLGGMPVIGCAICKTRPATYHGICNECKKQYMRDYSKKRFELRRQRIVEFHGNKCGTCGKAVSTDDSTVVIKAKKEFADDGRKYGRCYMWTKAEYEEAIPKCRLLCRSCQAYETNGFDLKLEMLRMWDEEKRHNETKF